MAKQCLICSDPRVKAINEEIRSGKPLTQVALMFNVSYDSLWYHNKNNHLIITEEEAKERLALHEEFNIEDMIRDLLRENQVMLRENNRNKGSASEKLKILAEQRQNIILLEKTGREFKEAMKIKLQETKERNRDEDHILTMRYRHGCNALTDEEYQKYAFFVRLIIKRGLEWKSNGNDEFTTKELKPGRDWFPGFPDIKE